MGNLLFVDFVGVLSHYPHSRPERGNQPNGWQPWKLRWKNVRNVTWRGKPCRPIPWTGRQSQIS